MRGNYALRVIQEQNTMNTFMVKSETTASTNTIRLKDNTFLMVSRNTVSHDLQDGDL